MWLLRNLFLCFLSSPLWPRLLLFLVIARRNMSPRSTTLNAPLRASTRTSRCSVRRWTSPSCPTSPQRSAALSQPGSFSRSVLGNAYRCCHCCRELDERFVVALTPAASLNMLLELSQLDKKTGDMNQRAPSLRPNYLPLKLLTALYIHICFWFNFTESAKTSST